MEWGPDEQRRAASRPSGEAETLRPGFLQRMRAESLRRPQHSREDKYPVAKPENRRTSEPPQDGWARLEPL